MSLNVNKKIAEPEPPKKRPKQAKDQDSESESENFHVNVEYPKTLDDESKDSCFNTDHESKPEDDEFFFTVLVVESELAEEKVSLTKKTTSQKKV